MNIDHNDYNNILISALGMVRPMGNVNEQFANSDEPSLIVIYGGTMPTASAFDSGWASLYEPVAGSEVLAKYSAIYTGASSGMDYTYDIDNIPTSGTYVADGTATWAAILPCYNATSYEGNSTYGPYTWHDTSTNPIAMLCDVTAPNSTGIVQLTSTTVSGTAPAFYTSAFTIGV